MLSEIDRFNWKDYTTAHGDALNIPIAINKLKNAKTEEDSNKFYWKIDNVVILQGRMYSSSLPTISCILDNIVESTNFGRSKFLELLSQIGQASLREDGYLEKNFRLSCLQEVSRGACLYFHYLQTETCDDIYHCIDLISISSIYDDSIKSKSLWFLNKILELPYIEKELKEFSQEWIRTLQSRGYSGLR